jgi:hypothetical protein
MSTINIPTFNIPHIPNVNDVTVDICNQTSQLINKKVIPPLNSSTKKIIEGLNIASTEIRSGILKSMSGIDTAVQISVEGINTSIDVINNSTKNLNKVLLFLQSLINTDTLIDTVKTIISLLVLVNIPPDQINNVTFYTNCIFYFFVFIIFVGPLLSIVFLFL